MRLSIRAYYRLRLLDADGRELRRWRRSLSRSFLLQYIEHLYSALGSAAVSVKDTGNTARTLQNPNAGAGEFLDIVAGAADQTHGIVVGSGTTAVAMDDVALEAIIAHGVGADQLQYQACTIATVSGSGDSRTVTISRSFTNGSGSAVTVNELGMYCDTEDSGGTDRYFAIVRDVLAAAVDVPNGQSLAVDYTIEISL